MDVHSSPANPPRKRAVLPGCAMRVFHLLRLFWVTELALLIVVLYGLRAGWLTPRQWSDGLFACAVIQVMIAGVIFLVPAGEALDASTLRYLDHGNVGDTREQLFRDTLRRRGFGLRAFLGALLTMLAAELVLLV